MRRAFVLLLITAAGCANQRSQSQELIAHGSQAALEGLYELAISDFQKAGEVDATNATAFFDLGLVYQKQQKWSDADAAIKKAIALDGRQPAFARALNALHDEQEKVEAAQKKAAAAAAAPKLEDLLGGALDGDSQLKHVGPGRLENVSNHGWANAGNDIGPRPQPPAPAGKSRPVEDGRAEVRGDIDKEVVQRVIKRHVNEVRFCYEKELMTKPDLQGRVAVQFTIGSTGDVVAAIVQSSTLNDPPTEQCIAHAVRRWVFPKPAGGIVIISYPFVLNHA